MIQFQFQDPSSYANIKNFWHQSINFDFKLSFKQKILTSKIQYHFMCLQPANYILLDINELKILKVRDNTDQFLQWQKVKNFKSINIGSCLIIDVGQKLKGDVFVINIQCQTNPNPQVTAFCWLQPHQTQGKKYPYFLTQCQPIYCRSIFPCQDTPSAKFTYQAKISNDMNLPIYLSAILKQQWVQKQVKMYSFSQKIPISSYLFAIVSGDLIKKKISNRIGAISQPCVIQDYSNQLQDAQKYMQLLQNLIFQYKWQQYNFVVLPTVFPFGGMENPVITFLSPCQFNKNKAFCRTYVHQMLHSWTGNLVSCQDWTCYWLNQGFTVYYERIALDSIVSTQFSKLLANSGQVQLTQQIIKYGQQHNYTKLDVILGQQNPDDAYSRVPYYKGARFLFSIQIKLGKQRFLKFLREFLYRHKQKSISSNCFKDALKDFSKEKWQQIGWDRWVNTPGYCPQPLSIKPQSITNIQKDTIAFLNNDKPQQTMFIKNLQNQGPQKVYQRILVLQNLQQKACLQIKQHLKQLDEKYNILHSLKSIKQKELWIRLCLKSGLSYINKAQSEILIKTGKSAIVTNTIKAIKNIDQQKAKELFLKFKTNYHPITNYLLQLEFK